MLWTGRLKVALPIKNMTFRYQMFILQHTLPTNGIQLRNSKILQIKPSRTKMGGDSLCCVLPIVKLFLTTARTKRKIGNKKMFSFPSVCRWVLLRSYAVLRGEKLRSGINILVREPFGLISNILRKMAGIGVRIADFLRDHCYSIHK